MYTNVFRHITSCIQGVFEEGSWTHVILKHIIQCTPRGIFAKYVGITWFIFPMFSNFYRQDLHNNTCVACVTKLVLQIVQFVNPWWNIYRNRIKIWSFLCLVMVIDECVFVDFLTWYIGPPNYCHYWV